jgi:hypothetical protein
VRWETELQVVEVHPMKAKVREKFMNMGMET